MFVDAKALSSGRSALLDDILPILSSSLDRHAVGKRGLLREERLGQQRRFRRPGVTIDKLADSSPAGSGDFRRGLFKRFRNPAFCKLPAEVVSPPAHGDGVTLTNPLRPRASGWRSRRSSTTSCGCGRRVSSPTTALMRKNRPSSRRAAGQRADRGHSTGRCSSRASAAPFTQASKRRGC